MREIKLSEVKLSGVMMVVEDNVNIDQNMLINVWFRHHSFHDHHNRQETFMKPNLYFGS